MVTTPLMFRPTMTASRATAVATPLFTILPARKAAGTQSVPVLSSPAKRERVSFEWCRMHLL